MSYGEDGIRSQGERRSATVLWLRLAHVFQKIDHVAVEQLRCRNLSIAQFDALAQIGAHEGLTQQELANHLLVTKGNISQLVEKMEQRGLLRRTAQGRVMRLWLTEQGRELYTGCVPAHEELLARQFLVMKGQQDLYAFLRASSPVLACWSSDSCALCSPGSTTSYDSSYMPANVNCPLLPIAWKLTTCSGVDIIGALCYSVYS